MSGGIVSGSDPVHVLGNNFAVSYDDGAEWAAVASVNVLDGKLNGPRHEWIVHVSLPLWPPGFRSIKIMAGSKVTDKIPRHFFGAASISPEHKLFGSNYDLRAFEKLQMPFSELP
jgi:hypothetical protein